MPPVCPRSPWTCDGQHIKVTSNRMCDLSRYVSFDPLAECGIKERVRFEVLQDLLAQYGSDEEELKAPAPLPQGRPGAQAHHRG